MKEKYKASRRWMKEEWKEAERDGDREVFTVTGNDAH
jgi:hypothetical protein